MNKRGMLQTTLAATLALASLTSCASEGYQQEPAMPRELPVLKPVPLVKSTSIAWQTDVKRASEVSVFSKKPLLMFFFADWCTYCKQMQQTTLADPSVQAFVNEKFVPVKINIDESELDDRIGINVVPLVALVDLNAERNSDLIIGFTDSHELLSHLYNFVGENSK